MTQQVAAITDEQRKAYLAADGDRCPFCGSDDIQTGSSDQGGHYFYQGVVCLNPKCKRGWTDTYSLSDVT